MHKFSKSVSVCQTDLMDLDLLPNLFADQFHVLVLFLSDFSYSSRCGRLSWPALWWSTYRRKKIYWFMYIYI